MPTYVYRCQSCGHTFEEEQRITDPPLTCCVYEDTEGLCFGKVKRVIQPVGVAYKGSGFHTTDYGRGSSGRKEGSYADYKEAAKAGKL